MNPVADGESSPIGGAPSAHLTRHELTLSDGAVVVLRRHGQADKPRLVLSHGNGLAIDGYRVFWTRLCEAFDVVVFDMRNHGESPTHELSSHSFGRMVLDFEEIWGGINCVFGKKPAVGVFHSMSAVASIEHLAAFGPVCDGLILFDPPVYPPFGHALERAELRDMYELAARARRRPPSYAAPEELAAQFSRGRAFRNWMPGAADDMAKATLRLNETSARWELACPREFEALIYETNNNPTAWSVLTRALPLPVLLIGADPNLEGQGPPALLCHAMHKEGSFDYVYIEGSSHFLQIEQPGRCVDEVLRFIRARVPSCDDSGSESAPSAST